MAIRQKIVVFTGAGISKESGIPTFRDANGMWKKYDAKKLASAEGFKENPQAVLPVWSTTPITRCLSSSSTQEICKAGFQKGSITYRKLRWKALTS